MKPSILFLTDHKTHSNQNSIYRLVQECVLKSEFGDVYVATRSDENNNSFFYSFSSTSLICIKANKEFNYTEKDFYKDRDKVTIDIHTVDFVWLRLPRPIPAGFFEFLIEHVPAHHIINNPRGITKTGSKAFLTEFPSLTAPLLLVHSKEELIEFGKNFPIVIKPLEDYGGRGIIRIDGEKIYTADDTMSIEHIDALLPPDQYPVIAMKFLKNVKNGDKRIVVCGGNIISSTLRLPAEGKWLCNVAQGGTSKIAEITQDEIRIVNEVSVKLAEYGVYLIGIDTLEEDDGTRVLSEINTLSVGGIAPAETTGDNNSKTVVDIVYQILLKNKNIYG